MRTQVETQPKEKTNANNKKNQVKTLCKEDSWPLNDNR